MFLERLGCEDEAGGEYSPQDENEKYIQDFGQEVNRPFLIF
jgi:hypothetical protein